MFPTDGFIHLSRRDRVRCVGDPRSQRREAQEARQVRTYRSSPRTQDYPHTYSHRVSELRLIFLRAAVGESWVDSMPSDTWTRPHGPKLLKIYAHLLFRRASEYQSLRPTEAVQSMIRRKIRFVARMPSALGSRPITLAPNVGPILVK